MDNFIYIFHLKLIDKVKKEIIVKIKSTFYAYNLKHVFTPRGLSRGRGYTHKTCRKCRSLLVSEKITCQINDVEKIIFVFFCPTCHKPYPEEGKIELTCDENRFDIFKFVQENKL